MGDQWDNARPTLRLFEVQTSATGSEVAVRDIEVHGGTTNWYIDLKGPPKSYRVDLGYLSSSGTFFVLGRSNVVTTSNPRSSDTILEDWADIAENYEKIYAESGASTKLKEHWEERLRRPTGAPLVTGYGATSGRQREFQFDVSPFG
jgi:hypothetical protein